MSILDNSDLVLVINNELNEASKVLFNKSYNDLDSESRLLVSKFVLFCILDHNFKD